MWIFLAKLKDSDEKLKVMKLEHEQVILNEEKKQKNVFESKIMLRSFKKRAK
jgi:hypothetical protein